MNMHEKLPNNLLGMPKRERPLTLSETFFRDKWATVGSIMAAITIAIMLLLLMAK